MKKIFLILILASSWAFGDNHPENKTDKSAPLITEIPTPYWEFVDIIGLLTTDEIIEILGEPAKKIDIKIVIPFIITIILVGFSLSFGQSEKFIYFQF